MFIKQALQGIGYGIIGALIVQVSVNAISQKEQEQNLTKPVLLKDLSQKQIESMSQLSNTVTLVPVKSHQEQNSSLKSFIVKPIPTHENETEAKKMKPEDIKDLRELLGNIEFANAELQQATQKLEQFKDIEKLVPVLNSIKEIDLGKHIQKIDFTKIGEEVFQGVRQSINAQNTVITNSVLALEKKSKDLNAIVQDLQELDELSSSFQMLKKGIQVFNLKMIIGSLVFGLGFGAVGGYVYSAYIQPKPFEKLLSKRAYTVEESNGFRDILVITTPFQSGNFKDGSAWIAFTFPQQQTTKKDQK